MKKKIAFAGFRHGHIMSLYDRAGKHQNLEIVAACEEDAATRDALRRGEQVNITHHDFTQMLDEVPCDLIAIGDYYTRRGSLAIEALRRGKHVLADKPLCTGRAELEEIAALAGGKGLSVFCMFDLRSRSVFGEARKLIREGKLGKIVQIQFSAQHPLLRDSRPAWYFEDGKHGGTINDIACHAIDLLPWLTGSRIGRIIAARSWKAMNPGNDDFRDAGQFMLELDNGCGVMGDVSYSAPDSIAYSHPCYWRFNIWGTGGMIEFRCEDPAIHAWLNGNAGEVLIQAPEQSGADYLDDFLAEIDGTPGELTTAAVLQATRTTLEIQALADKQP